MNNIACMYIALFRCIGIIYIALPFYSTLSLLLRTLEIHT